MSGVFMDERVLECDLSGLGCSIERRHHVNNKVTYAAQVWSDVRTVSWSRFSSTAASDTTVGGDTPF